MKSGIICIALLDRGWEGCIMRIGGTTRTSKHWIKSYKSEGFKRTDIREIKITNETNVKYNVGQYKEMFLYDLASYLEQQSCNVLRLSEYKYLISNTSIVTQFLDNYKEGYIIPREHVEEEVNDTYRRICIVM